jgi:hypothetical protein
MTFEMARRLSAALLITAFPLSVLAQMGPMMPMPASVSRDGQCKGAATAFIGALAIGQVINRGEQRGGYQLPAPFLAGYALRVDDLRLIEFDTFVSSPGVTAMVVCHGTVVLTDQTRAMGKIIVQQTGLPAGLVTSWLPDR